ncbi:MAG: type 1 glutamine amidotransferase domain-containing protein, partial [Ekhidna sp.]|nr:type 1 glutamine amidotransferase domain-containing protein [Ekhidna sp.]
TDHLDDPLNKSFMEGEGAKSFASTEEIASVDTKSYDAIFIPGGLGPMVDMPDNKIIQDAIVETYERDAVVGAVCHGPVSLLNVNLSDGNALVDGKTIASFTNEEEEGYAKEDVPFLLESALKEKGAKFISVAPWQPNSIADGKLVTGQNPASAIGVAEKIIGILEN